MNIHEYQAKEILKLFGVPVPRGKVAWTPDDAKSAAQELGTPCVVKAQIHAGGRGKAGGVKVVKSLDDARAFAQAIIGQSLVTPQTGPAGRKVSRVLVEEGIDIAEEMYLSVLLDPSLSTLSIIACAEGGVEIEEVARKMPDKILKEDIDPTIGLLPFQIRRLASGLGLVKENESVLNNFLQCLVKSFMESDCLLVEINPMVLTHNGKLFALDAKMNFDGNAMYRRKEIADLRDPDEEDPKEVLASKFGLSYIALEGNIGCMVNGAGLAMATMDIIKQSGGDPANFLDVGGGADKERVAQAFRILLADDRVKGVLINIFGGIMKCDVIAEGVVEAASEIGVTIPLVVRLQGTNVDLGKKILSESKLSIISVDTMEEAAQMIVRAVT